MFSCTRSVATPGVQICRSVLEPPEGRTGSVRCLQSGPRKSLPSKAGNVTHQHGAEKPVQPVISHVLPRMNRVMLRLCCCFDKSADAAPPNVELRHEEVFPIYGKGEAQFLPYMGKSARQGLAALTLYG